MQFERGRAGPAWTVDVFDVRGRRVWTGRAGAGERMLSWSVATGPPVPMGVYFARVRPEAAAPQRLRFVIF
jgi:hypothetical protein